MYFSLVASSAHAQLPPHGRWESIDTEHFVVTYAEGLEPLARRAAERAEAAYALLSRELLEPPAGRIDLVVTNNLDLANGYASPFPRNRMVIYAHPPVDTPELAFSEDWLGLLVLHELAHLFHLDTARGIWEELRAVLGRSPLLFPSAVSPGWLIEGVATQLESSLTGGGRVRGTLYEMMVRTAILEDAFPSLDRVTGTPTRWPGSATRYVYGSRFLDYLARTRGQAGVNAFLERYAGRIPFRLNAAARPTLGSTLGRAWEAWERELRARYLPLADSLRAAGLTEPEMLSRAGRVASFPRYAPDGTLAWAAATGVERPEIRTLSPDGREGVIRERREPSAFAWTRDGSEVVYGDFDWADPYRLWYDLYLADRDGETRRLTHEARIAEPDPHPDGRRVVAVADAAGTNVLVIHDLATGETRRLTPPSLDAHWALPRWSPAGDRIAAARWTSGGRYDVVVLDSTGTVLREVTRDRAVDSAPTWSPDGRWILFSSDRSGIANLYAHELATGELRQVTNLLTGGFEPVVSPDGRWIAFSWYRADGYHVARIRFDPASWRPAPPLRAEVARPLPARDHAATAGGASRPYSPWRSLAPATWIPVVESREGLGLGVGVALAGTDVLARHDWLAWATAYPDDARGGAGLRYDYRGLGNPVLALSLEQSWDVTATTDASDDPLPTPLLDRERDLGAALLWTRRGWGSTTTLGLVGEIGDTDFAWDDPERAGDLRIRDRPVEISGSAQLAHGSARAFPLSVGPQEGGTLVLRTEAHRYLSPLEGDSVEHGYLRLIGRARRYLPVGRAGGIPHVLALRADAGAELGSSGPGLRVGGASGGSSLLPVDFGLFGEAIGFPVRGYAAGIRRGDRAAIGSAEYRFPLATVERGIGLLPLFLDRVSGGLFLDAGAAWCAGSCAGIPGAVDTFSLLPSVGAELQVELQVGFAADLPLRFGAALPLRDPGRGRPQLYLRSGRAF